MIGQRPDNLCDIVLAPGTAPGAVVPAIDHPPSKRSLMLQTDIACADCRYNLRGLPAESRCPECGAPASRSIADQMRSTDDDHLHDHLEQLLDGLLEHVTSASGVSADGAWMVIDVARSFDRREPITPEDFCRVLQEMATQYHGGDALFVLEDVGLLSGEEVGRVVDSLTQLGLVLPMETTGDWSQVGPICSRRGMDCPPLPTPAGYPTTVVADPGSADCTMLIRLCTALGIGLQATGAVVCVVWLLWTIVSGSSIPLALLILPLLLFVVPGVVLRSCVNGIRQGAISSTITAMVTAALGTLLLFSATAGTLIVSWQADNRILSVAYALSIGFTAVLLLVVFIYSIKVLRAPQKVVIISDEPQV